MSAWAGREAGPAPDASRGRCGRGPGGAAAAAAAAAAAGEGHGVSASPAGPRWWPGGRDEEEEEEEVSRLRAGEPRGPAGRRGARPLPSLAPASRGRAAWSSQRGCGGGGAGSRGAELRAARAARFPGARAALAGPPSAPLPEPGTPAAVSQSCCALAIF